MQLRAQGVPITGADLAVIAKCKPTAMNNRLAALERHGLATSYVVGRRRFFQASVLGQVM